MSERIEISNTPDSVVDIAKSILTAKTILMNEADSTVVTGNETKEELFSKIESALKQAIEIAKKTKNPKAQAKLNDSLNKLQKSKGEFSEALELDEGAFSAIASIFKKVSKKAKETATAIVKRPFASATRLTLSLFVAPMTLNFFLMAGGEVAIRKVFKTEKEDMWIDSAKSGLNMLFGKSLDDFLDDGDDDTAADVAQAMAGGFPG